MHPLLLSVLTNKKVIIYSLIAVMIVVALYFLRKEYKAYQKRKEAKNQLDQIENDTRKSNLTHPLSSYGIWADSIKEAMQGMWENEEAVYSVFRNMNTRDDVLRLITEFGVFKDMTLTQWIVKYFNDNEKEIVNRILIDKDIDYKF